MSWMLPGSHVMPESKNGPKPLRIGQQAMILHILGVQVLITHGDRGASQLPATCRQECVDLDFDSDAVALEPVILEPELNHRHIP